MSRKKKSMEIGRREKEKSVRFKEFIMKSVSVINQINKKFEGNEKTRFEAIWARQNQ